MNGHKIYLVSCTKKKKEIPTKAKDLYDSVLFNLIKDKMRDKTWYILSAKHTLLFPETSIEPYNLSLDDLTITERKVWSEIVFKQLQIKHNNDIIVFLTGKRYYEYLTILCDQNNISYEIPMLHLGIGQKQKYIKEHVLE